MRKTILFALIISTWLQPVLSQEYFNKKENQNQRHLVLVHPTRSNLERYSYLIDEGILNPGKLEVVGLYFEAENYNYEEVIKDFPDFGFHMIPGKIELEDLYQENSATEEFRKIFKYSKATIFNGGPDIPPAAYGEEMSLLTNVTDPYRHYYEISFLFHLMGGSQNEDFRPFMKKRPKYIILGICLGMQSMNVAAGGTLIQDIPTEVYGKTTVEMITEMEEGNQHRNYFSNLKTDSSIKSYFLHPIKIIPGRWLDSKIENNGNPEPHIFSSHHQALEKLGKDLRIAATSVDGKIIEAIEHHRYPNVYGIQFHPEVDYLYKDSQDYRFHPDDELFSLREELTRRNSLNFHLLFWNMISESF